MDQALPPDNNSQSPAHPWDLIAIEPVFSEPMFLRLCVFAAVLCVYALALAANSLLLAAILHDRRLRRPPYALMAALAATGLVETTNALPRTLYDLAAGPSSISVPWCVAKMFMYHVSFRVHGYVLAAMAIDRYVAVCRPLAYGRLASNAVAMRVLGLVVVLSSAQGLGYVAIVLNLELCRPRVLLTATCDFLALRTLSCNLLTLSGAYTYAVMAVGIVVPLCAIAALYGLVLRECRRPGCGGREGKALQTCCTHLLVVGIYFGAILVTFASGLRAPANTAASKQVTVALQSLQFLLPPALNPIIYGLRTAEVKSSIVRFLRGRVGPWKVPVKEGGQPHVVS